MSREQWGHGYWKRVEDAQSGKVRNHHTFRDEVKYWIAQMCRFNHSKTYDQSLYPVKEWIWCCTFSGASVRYAKKVYDYILNENYYDFDPECNCWCYVSGDPQDDWQDDYFVIPTSDHTKDEWTEIADNLLEKIKGA